MMRRGADAATAEDLAQETLLTVWRRASLYAEEKGSAAGWVFAIARNLHIDRLRREVPWQELPEERMEQASAELAPDEAVSEREREARVRAALAELPRAARGRGFLPRRPVAREIAARLVPLEP
jgi:RNA polymerase sigma-70 factor (ECF subfamily)